MWNRGMEDKEENDPNLRGVTVYVAVGKISKREDIVIKTVQNRKITEQNTMICETTLRHLIRVYEGKSSKKNTLSNDASNFQI